MIELTQKTCVPCQGGVPALKGVELHNLQVQLKPGWDVVDEHHLKKAYTFKDFAEALVFTNLVGVVAEVEGHHPDIALSWGKVKIEIFTHKIDGLTENDFILAAKIDTLNQ
jgi:4a-hydroxytetrahydrobiopterin dehydratase